MEKELKSCMGVLLRADLMGQGHPTLLGRNRLIGWIGYAQLGQPSKRHPCRILIFFPIMFYYIFSTTYQKNEDLFSLAHMSGLSQCVSNDLNFPFWAFSCHFCPCWSSGFLRMPQNLTKFPDWFKINREISSKFCRSLKKTKLGHSF